MTNVLDLVAGQRVILARHNARIVHMCAPIVGVYEGITTPEQLGLTHPNAEVTGTAPASVLHTAKRLAMFRCALPIGFGSVIVLLAVDDDGEMTDDEGSAVEIVSIVRGGG